MATKTRDMDEIVLDKHRATWYWTHRNKAGGSFGSNHCGAQRDALTRALLGVPSGAPYRLIVNGKVRGVFARE